MIDTKLLSGKFRRGKEPKYVKVPKREQTVLKIGGRKHRITKIAPYPGAKGLKSFPVHDGVRVRQHTVMLGRCIAEPVK